MEVIMMPPPGAYLSQPLPVPFCLFAHLNLCTWKDKYSRNAFVFCGGFQDFMMRTRPIVVHVGPVCASQRDRRNVLSFLARQFEVRSRQHPDVCIQSNLVAAMSGEHGPAPRLRNVPNIEPPPPRLFRGHSRQIFDEIDRLGMSPISVPGQPHSLPGGAGFRQLNAAGKTALGVASERGRALR